MSENTKIQWTDATHNFWQGCTKVSPGCTNCYAAERDKRFFGGKHWGKGAPRVRSSSFEEPLKWNKKPLVCDKCGNAQESDTFCYADGCDGALFHRRRVFSLSLGDWLDPEVPIEWLADMLDVIRRCTRLDWLLLTKRPELFKARLISVEAMLAKCDTVDNFFLWVDDWLKGYPPANVMVLTSVENQDAADERYAELLDIPGRRGISVEPLLGPVNLHLQHGCRGCNHPGNIMPAMNANGRCSECDGTGQEPSGIDWVIVGGESGHHARPCNVDWIESIKDQCAEAGVPCFVKQLGKNPGYTIDGEFKRKVLVLDKAHGGDMDEWPEEVSVRQFYK